ncbi:MAG: ATP-binding protein, partial [Leeuwenhoekiella sp.]
IKYCTPSGHVEVRIENSVFIVKNSGNVPLNHSDKLFDRFYKENTNSHTSTGLGLAIVKNICEEYGFVIMYRFEEKEHIFKIDFSQKLK